MPSPPSGIDLLPRRDALRAAVGAALGPDRAQARDPRRPAGPHALDALLRALADVPRARREPVARRPAQRQRRRAQVDDGRDHRRDQRRAGVCVHPHRVERRGDYRVRLHSS
jgi:hypothetical protein